MAILGFKKIRTSNPELMRVQDEVEQILNPLAKLEILDGHLLRDISITAGTPLVVNHGLARPVIGWVVVRKNANADIWDSQDTNRIVGRTLVLNSDANVQLSLYVF